MTNAEELRQLTNEKIDNDEANSRELNYYRVRTDFYMLARSYEDAEQQVEDALQPIRRGEIDATEIEEFDPYL